MKLNNDCIRDILVSVESLDFGESWIITDLSEKLPDYTEDQLEYHCIQLVNAGFLEASVYTPLGSPTYIRQINDLTYQGHQFLADIRSEDTWNKTKSIAKSVGSESLHAIKDIAAGIVTSAIQKKLGL